MRTYFLLFSLLLTQVVSAQDVWEQDLYSHQIDLMLSKPNNVYHFLDSTGKFIGKKQLRDSIANYYDQRQRFIKSRVIQREKAVKGDSAVKVEVNVFANGAAQTKVARTKRRRNKITYYDSQGNVIRTARKSLFSSKITYRNAAGKIIGSRKSNSDGVTTYRDRARRITGRSYLNESGVTIFEANKNRITPQFMLSEPFLFR